MIITKKNSKPSKRKTSDDSHSNKAKKISGVAQYKVALVADHKNFLVFPLTHYNIQ